MKAETVKGWRIRASAANHKGFKFLLAAKRCFELAEIAKAQADRMESFKTTGVSK